MALVLALTDEVVRIADQRRAAGRFHDIVVRHGVPASFSPVDRALLQTGARLAPRMPGLVMPLVLRRLRSESDGVVLPAEDPAFTGHVARRHAEGLGVNVNVLGEAVLGDDEARRRLAEVVARVRRPDVDYVSVKASAICAQLSSLAFEHSVSRVAERLRLLYREAASANPRVFVNLDMEEHRDLELTLTSFMRVLDEPDFRSMDAGIVLQAYLPDSHDALDELCHWARARHDAGGGAIKVRIVKGANLAMERVEAELRGWPQAPYMTKAETDASWKRLLESALDARWAGAVRVGAASHNLFDVAFALTLAERLDARSRLDIEMLEGMAEGAAKAVGDTRLYTPVVRHDDFEAAIAYLVRRLDEGTAPGHFLADLFRLTPDSPAFATQRDMFLRAARDRATVSTAPRRTQDRSTERIEFDADEPFANEADTDWSLAPNRAWVERALASWSPGEEPVLHTDVAAVDEAVAVAQAAGRRWARSTPAERRALLTRAAEEMAKGRDEAIAVMAHEAGKAPAQGDPEVSEAIDFARYYAGSTRLFEEADAQAEALGVVVVAPPWNFPYAIPAGGVLAALAAGNAVILKPAPETVRTARVLAEHLWAAGIPRDLLQLLRVPDNEVGRRLITHPDVDAVILTGAAATAELFLGWRPDLRLHAETSGKNAVVVTATADLDLAVKDVVTSAFGHAGQKCSAASLVIVERSVLDDGRFLRRLVDATRTLRVGESTDLASDVTPLIRPAEGWLADALSGLEPGEQWLLEPTQVGERLWSPGIKVGVRPGSRSHLEEWFGPVLGIMAAEDLDDAIRLQNAPSFGLTGGIHALDPEEVERWLASVEVGNAYVNRAITGAIVRRQPFGGWKRSVVGPGAKAGGPGYVASLSRWRDTTGADDRLGDRLGRARASYAAAWRDMGVERDASGLVAEANILRHRPLPGVVVRVEDGESSSEDLDLCLLAARTVGTPVVVSRAEDESWEALAARLPGLGVSRIRVLGGPVAEGLLRAANAAWVHVLDEQPVAEGRVELRRWVREQAISRTLHRYGNLP
ncbi:MAG: RHH-type transcriptional regulator, proline utilization regulon repressor / proline dehydrogenase [Acidimicrobiaceae bacterium]|nr:RHH-type transcriptional regulator, proline utilization regulon repressor / proline dehydrogenase [Acidimicrobiaceae bacterium]